jgi:hypothetical protein
MTTRLKRAIGLGLAALVIALLISLNGANADDTVRSTAAVPVPAAAPSWTGEQAGRMIIPAALFTVPKVSTLADPSIGLGAGKSIPALT